MKEFKTIDEQISILESRGVLTNDKTPLLLLRENYYSVINGYKDIFLDKEAMESSNEDVYKNGVKFDWIYSLFEFDRELRQLTFNYLIKAESALKTATVYAFCQNHQSCTDYLDRSSFCSPKDLLTPKSFKGNHSQLHAKNLNYLMEILNSKLSSNTYQRPFISHYIDVYGEVPLWVLCNDLTFGNMSHFYQLMNRRDQNSVCKILFKTTLRTKNDSRITPHEVLRAYDVLVRFRNICAHDERLYCAKVVNDTYATLLTLLPIALPKAVVEKLKKELLNLIDKYDKNIHELDSKDLKKQLGLI